jgi:hypothetical protein
MELYFNLPDPLFARILFYNELLAPQQSINWLLMI